MIRAESRPPTRFQRHVLQTLSRYGPCGLAAVAQGCRAPAEAVRLAVWLLRQGGFVRRCGQCRYVVTTAGTVYLNRTLTDRRR